MIRPLPGRLVLIGDPVTHSLSPRFQNAALRSAAIPLQYEAIKVSAADLASVVADLAAVSATGNITIPHKVSFAALCRTLTGAAEIAGAVNTFWVENGVLHGDNTDVEGFNFAVERLLGSTPIRQTVALLGAGGAAAAVLSAANQWQETSITIWNRTREKSVAVAERFGGVRVAAVSEQAVKDATLVVNATSIGMTDDSFPVDPALIPETASVLDIVCRIGGTAWVRAARGRGLNASDGREMLIAQGAASFRRWFGLEPDVAAMRGAIGLTG